MSISWASLHQKHQAEAIRVAAKILHDGGFREFYSVAEDVVQDAWIIAWQKATSDDHARALLFRCTRIRALDLTRTEWRHEKLRALAEPTQQTTVELGWGATAQPILIQAVQDLCPESFEAWYLKDVKKLSLSEVGDIQQVKFSTLNSRLARARNILKGKSAS